MAEAAIPFAPLQESGMEVLAGASPLALNVVSTGKGVLERRPGIAAFSPYQSGVISAGPVECVYQEPNGSLFAVGTRLSNRLYQHHSWCELKRAHDSETYVHWMGQLSGSQRPVFSALTAVDPIKGHVAVASGSTLQRLFTLGDGIWELTATGPGGGWGHVVTEEELALIPSATHVTWMAGRAIANESRWNQEQVRYSELADYTRWTAGSGTAGAFTAENAPDKLVAVQRVQEYLFAFGSQTTQLYSPDPTWVFAPVITLAAGCSAPYSIIDCQYWIDQYKRVVRYEGGSVTSVSSPIQGVLDSMCVSDAYGFRVGVGAIQCLVWVFPTDGRTFVLQEGSGWSQWQSGVADPGQFQVSSHCRAVTGENIVGTLSGQVGKLDMAAPADFSGAIQSLVETGYLNRETGRRKVSKRVTLTLERGTSGSAATAVFGYRDRPGPWRNKIPVSLGGPGKTTHTLRFFNLGIYDSRQWFFEFTGSERLALVSAVEEYEVI